MTRPRFLVAGIGNIFLGDDAFGCEAIRLLMGRTIPEDVKVVDYGIRGFDLTFALLEDYEAFILVDAAPRGEAPGTLYTIEVDVNALDQAAEQDMMVDAHAMNPMRVLATAKAMGANPAQVFVVGCEPSPMQPGEEEERMGLSEPVQAALDDGVVMIESLIHKLKSQEGEKHERSGESASDYGSGGGGHCRVA